MREIKFRGKRVDNGEWVDGWYVGYSEAQGYIHRDYIDKDEVWSVDAETVGQYTGLKDKNGVEIYEGDMLASGGADEWYIGGCVSYCDDKDCMLAGGFFLAEDTEGHVSDFWENDWSEIVVHMEVIGNIHDNPELMETV